MEFSSKEFPLSRFRASAALSAASDILHAQATHQHPAMGGLLGGRLACNLICLTQTCRMQAQAWRCLTASQPSRKAPGAYGRLVVHASHGMSLREHLWLSNDARQWRSMGDRANHKPEQDYVHPAKDTLTSSRAPLMLLQMHPACRSCQMMFRGDRSCPYTAICTITGASSQTSLSNWTWSHLPNHPHDSTLIPC